MSTLLGNSTISPDALETMRSRGGVWFAYQNVALDSADLGGLRFLQVGEGRTFATPPTRYPDTPQYGIAWRYMLVGQVNLKTGEIDERI